LKNQELWENEFNADKTFSEDKKIEMYSDNELVADETIAMCLKIGFEKLAM